MPYIPDIDGTGALNTLSQYSQSATGSIEQTTGEIVQFTGNTVQSVESNGTSFFTSLKSLTGTGAAAVAAVGGVTIPTAGAIVAACGAMALGAQLGDAWYDSNTDFWNEVGEEIYNLNPDLSGSVWTWIENGKMYIDKAVMDLLAGKLLENGALTGVNEYVDPPAGVVTSWLSLSDLLSVSYWAGIKALNDAHPLHDRVYNIPLGEVLSLCTTPGAGAYGMRFTLLYDNIHRCYWVSRIKVYAYFNPSYTITRISEHGVIANSSDFTFDSVRRYIIDTSFDGSNYSPLSITYQEDFLPYDGGTGRYIRLGAQYAPNADTLAEGSYSYDFPMTDQALYSDENNYIGVGSFELVYPMDGVRPQENADIMQSGDTIATKYPDWMSEAITRPTKWSVDEETGDIKIDETITTLPLEFPFALPNPVPNPNPEINPNPDPLADPWKQAQEATEDLPDEDQAQDRRQAGDLPSTADWPFPESLPDTYKQLYEDLAELIAKDTGDVPEIEPPTGGTGTAPAIVVPVGDAQALFTVYNPTQAQINSFGAWLWSSSFIDNLIKVIENPIDCIISLKKIFITPDTSGAANIYCGHLNSGISANLVSAQYKEIDLGSIDIPLHFYDATDFEPYTSISCYLPFIGMVELSAHDCVEATMSIKYVVDCYNGDFTANIELSKDDFEGVTYVYTGSCAVEYPITGSNHAALALGAAVTAVTSVMTGGLSLAALAGLGTQLGGKQSINGQMSGNAGACGNKTPYVIIKRTIPKPASNFSKYRGFGASKLVNIGNLSGYTRVKAIITDGIEGANDSEIQEIESILKDGFIAG